MKIRPVSYGSVGMTAAADAISFPPPGFHVQVTTQRVGSGSERFATTRDALLTWGMHRKANLEIEVTAVGDNDGYQGLRQNDDGQWQLASHHREFHFASDGQAYLTPGTEITVRGQWRSESAPIAYRIIYNVNETRRSGFAWGTLDEHPLSGEEYFGLEWRDDDTVWAVVISITAFPESRSRLLREPILRLEQRLRNRKLVKSLSPVNQADS
jgi:uncharacterized protein (UPF0548 family)